MQKLSEMFSLVVLVAGDCVYLSRAENWEWKRGDCNVSRDYACQMDIVHDLTQLFPQCPYGYTFQNGDSCIKDVPEKVTWQQAKALCDCTKGEHLVSITTEAEFTYLLAMHGLVTGDKWLGLTNRNSASFYWTDSSAAFNFSKWQGSVPTGSDVCVATQLPEGTWVEVDCNSQEKSWCESPAYQPTKKQFCLQWDNMHQDLLDDNPNTCMDISTFEQFHKVVELNRDCLGSCSTEVRVAVTLSNAQTCAEVPLFHQSNSTCEWGPWEMCLMVSDHLQSSAQCELLCHCYNGDSHNCPLALRKRPSISYPVGYSVCEIMLL